MCKYLAAQFHDFALKYSASFETKFANIWDTVTKLLGNIFYVHGGSKIAHFHDLCTNPLKISFLLKFI